MVLNRRKDAGERLVEIAESAKGAKVVVPADPSSAAFPLVGALIVGVFQLGLRMIGTDPQWTYLLIGVLIIAAVTIDQWIRKVSG